MTRDPETDRVTGATGLLNIWLLKHDGIKEKGRKSVDAISMELESGFLDQVVKEEVPEGLPEGARLLGLAERRWEFCGKPANL